MDTDRYLTDIGKLGKDHQRTANYLEWCFKFRAFMIIFWGLLLLPFLRIVAFHATGESQVRVTLITLALAITCTVAFVYLRRRYRSMAANFNQEAKALYERVCCLDGADNAGQLLKHHEVIVRLRQYKHFDLTDV